MPVKTATTCLGAVLFCLALAGSVAAATPESFRTAEYERSGVLDVINAAEAYALGYTGAGVTVGVIDEAIRSDHPELAGKVAMAPAFIDGSGELFRPDWRQDTHGSHVGGIIAARRDGVGMHGVAFDAALWGGPFLTDSGEAILLDFDAYFAARPEVRIFNNSWGYLMWERYYDPVTSKDASREEVLEAIDPDLGALFDHALDYPESVIVFAASNEGRNSPIINALLPRYAGSALGNWISVGALDSEAITRDDQGEL